MSFWKIFTFACAASIIVDAKHVQHQKREITSNNTHICDPLYNNSNRIQCFCVKDIIHPEIVKSAECSITVAAISYQDAAWNVFRSLSYASKIIFTNTRGIPLTYVPTNALKFTTGLKKLEIKYAVINTIFPYAFANHSYVEEMVLRDNQIVTLQNYAFAHHKNLKMISLDTNSLSEINRDIFVDLPNLEKLYLTNNQISTIHDKAFINLENLKELEIDRNKIFSLNFASFDGLSSLEKLDISGNTLEVIGDNTFSALGNLKTLNLEGNKIQMLDDKAFDGLTKLMSLSLARNSLTILDNDKVFAAMVSLTSLSLRGNQIKEIKPNALAPILTNFNGNATNIDVEENNFPCDCRLEWFMTLMNKTLNKHVKVALENFKCFPDAKLKEAWIKTTETEKNNQPVIDETDPAMQSSEYEYYDDSQLNGKLFYLDVRDLLNCNNDTTKKPTTEISTTAAAKDITSPRLTSVETTSPEIATSTKHLPESTTGIQTPTHIDTTLKTEVVSTTEEKAKETTDHHDITTMKLATVSAKPVDTKIYENMASDEAKPERIKAHRSIQEELKTPKENNASTRNLSCFTMLLVLLIVAID